VAPELEEAALRATHEVGLIQIPASSQITFVWDGVAPSYDSVVPEIRIVCDDTFRGAGAGAPDPDPDPETNSDSDSDGIEDSLDRAAIAGGMIDTSENQSRDFIFRDVDGALRGSVDPRDASSATVTAGRIEGEVTIRHSKTDEVVDVRVCEGGEEPAVGVTLFSQTQVDIQCLPFQIFVRSGIASVSTRNAAGQEVIRIDAPSTSGVTLSQSVGLLGVRSLGVGEVVVRQGKEATVLVAGDALTSIASTFNGVL
jgi:hypothetical protein